MNNNIHPQTGEGGKSKGVRAIVGPVVGNVEHISMKLFASSGDRISGYKLLSRTPPSSSCWQSGNGARPNHLVARNNDQAALTSEYTQLSSLTEPWRRYARKRRSETDACVFNAHVYAPSVALSPTNSLLHVTAYV